MTDYAALRAKGQRKGRRFHIIMGASCGLFVLLLVSVVWLVVATEPRRRAAYLANCQTTGFSAQQCTFLYSERKQRDAESAAAIGLGAAALAVSAGRR